MAKVDLISHIQLAKTIRILSAYRRFFVCNLETTGRARRGQIVSMVHDKDMGAPFTSNAEFNPNSDK